MRRSKPDLIRLAFVFMTVILLSVNLSSSDTPPRIPDTAYTAKQGVLNEVNGLLAKASKHDREKLKEASKNLAESLDPSLWVDGNHLQVKGGEHVFHDEKEAVEEFIDLLKDKKNTISATTLRLWIDTLVGADRTLAETALNEAIGLPGDSKEIAKARKEMAEAEKEYGKGKYGDTIDHYGKAWKHTVDALKKSGNHPPVANAGPDQSVLVGDTVHLDGSKSSDVDGDLLTFHWSFTSKPAASTAALSSSSDVKPTFVVDKPGTYVVQLVVSDGKVDSAPETVSISTQNSKPIAEAGPDQTVFVGTTVTLDGSKSSDVDGDLLTYKWLITLVPSGSAAILSDPLAVKPTFVVDKPGAYVVQLVVNDGKVDSAPDTVNVTTENSPPVANAGPDQTVFVTQTVTLDGSKSSDVDGDPLTYKWSFTSVPPGSAATLSDPSAVKPSFVVDKPGTYVVQLIVNDGKVDSAPDTVSTSTQNSKPIAEAGPDETVFVTQTVTLDGSKSTDIDGDILTFKWSFITRPSGSAIILSDPTAVNPTFVVDKFGNYVAQLIVNDGKVDSAPDTVNVTTENSPPVANAGPDQTAFVTQAVTLDGSKSSDVDGDPLAYTWSFTSVPPGSTATLSDLSTVKPTFVVDKPGNYVVQLIVNDGKVDSAPDTVNVTTENSPPVGNAGPDQTVFVTQAVMLDGSKSSDVDGDPLTFRWSFTSKPTGSVATLSDPAAPNPTFLVDLFGIYVVQLIVNDGTADSAPKTVTITTVNSKPVANAGPDQTVYIGDNVQVDGSASSDADKDLLTFSWSILSKPDQQSIAVLDSPSSMNPTFIPDLSGLYVVQVIVNDGKVNSDPDTTTITANLKMVNVPDAVGMTQAAAESAIIAVKLAVGTITQANSATVPAGNVISQNPTAGTSVAEGSSVNIVISSGPVMVSVPNVVGMTQAAAQSTIIGVSLSVGTITTSNSATVPAGSVISQNPAAGSSVAEGSPVNLVISSGPVKVNVPNIVGLTQSEAQSAITGAKLILGTVTTATSTTVLAGRVISQSPAADTSVSEGSPVNFVVSLGPPSTTVPNVLGLSQGEARSAIVAAGLIVGAVTSDYHDTIPPGSVISQNPAGGSSAAQGSSVNLVISQQVPVGATTAWIGPAGGTLTDPGGASLFIPPGALSELRLISIFTHRDITSLPAPAPFLAGVNVGPNGLTFRQPVTITIPLLTGLPPGTKLPVYTYDDQLNAWLLTTFVAEVNADGASSSVAVTHFTDFIEYATVFGDFDNKFQDICHPTPTADLYQELEKGLIEAFPVGKKRLMDLSHIKNANTGLNRSYACYEITGIELSLFSHRARPDPTWRPDPNIPPDQQQGGWIFEEDFYSGVIVEKLWGPIVMRFKDIVDKRIVDAKATCAEEKQLSSTIILDVHWACTNPDLSLQTEGSELHPCETTGIKAVLTCGGEGFKQQTISFSDLIPGMGVLNPSQAVTDEKGETFVYYDSNPYVEGATDIRAEYAACPSQEPVPPLRENTPISVKYKVSSLEIQASAVQVNVGGTVTLNVEAHDENNNLVNVDPKYITWSIIPPKTVMIDPSQATIRVGDTQPLTATGCVADLNPTTGVPVSLSGKNKGSVTVIATYDNGCERKTASTPITVIGEGTVEWFSNNLNVVNFVGKNGVNAVVTGVSPGEANIKAVCDDAIGVSKITVIDLKVRPPLSCLLPGGKVQLEAFTLDQNGNEIPINVTWSSDKPSVATCNPLQGSVTVVNAMSMGIAIITATDESKGISTTAKIVVSDLEVRSWQAYPSFETVNWSETDSRALFAETHPQLLASDGQGNVFAAWMGITDPYPIVTTYIGWVDNNSGEMWPIASFPRAYLRDLFVDGRGNMIVLYVPKSDTANVPSEELWARSYNTDRGWDGGMRLLSGAGVGATGVKSHMAADGRGNAFLVLSFPNNSELAPITVGVWRYDADLGWTEYVEIDRVWSDPPVARIAMNPSGDAIVAWTGYDYDANRRTVLARRYLVGQGWDQVSTQIFSPQVLYDDALNVLMDAQGNVIVAAYCWGSGTWAMHRNIVTGWSSPIKIANNPDPDYSLYHTYSSFKEGGYYRISMDESGNAMIVFEKLSDLRPGRTTSLMSRRYRTGSGWDDTVETVEAVYSSDYYDYGVKRFGLAFRMHGCGSATLVAMEASPSIPGALENFPYEVYTYARHYTPYTGWEAASSLLLGTNHYDQERSDTSKLIGEFYQNRWLLASHVDTRGNGIEVWDYHEYNYSSGLPYTEFRTKFVTRFKPTAGEVTP